MIQNILFYHVLCAVRIEMENYFPHTYHGLSMDRTSTDTGPIITRVEAIERAKYGYVKRGPIINGYV
jgi:hypothetical protein